MNKTLEYIKQKYNLSWTDRDLIVEIPDTDRNTFATLLAELHMNDGVEMGVERGLYSEVLCKANPDLYLRSIDAWAVYEGYRDHVTQQKISEIYIDARKRLMNYNCTLIRAFSMDAVKKFEDNTLDFVYIDGNHEYQQVVNDIAEWQKKVRVGGIISGHDYILRKGGQYLMHVPHAVEGYIKSYGIHPLFLLGRKHAEPGERRDSSRSWFYVKPDPQSVVPHKSA